MIGIDIPINRVVTQYEALLWTDSDYFGRVYPNSKKEGVIPEVANGNNYKEVLLNSKKAATVFFYVLPNRNNPADVWIHFSIDLVKAYPTLNRDEATEQAILEAKDVTELGGMHVDNVITGVEAFETWEFVNQGRMDNHPYFLFRLETTVPFEALCEVGAKTTYNLNLSSEGDGITEPYEGSQAQAINSTVPINALADENNQFVRWLINGVEVLDKLTTVFMNKTVNAIAYFESALVVIQDVFSQIPVNLNNRYYYPNEIENINKFRRNVVVFANSIGAASYYYLGLQEKLFENRGQYYEYDTINSSVGSRTGAEMITDYPTTAKLDIIPTYDNWIVIFEFTNSIGGGATAQEAYDDVVTCCNLARADGYKVIVCTATPVGHAWDTEVTTANALVNTNWITFADYKVDVQEIPETLLLGNPLYYIDDVHPTALLSKLITDKISDETMLANVDEFTNIQVKNSQVARFEDTLLTLNYNYIPYPTIVSVFKVDARVTNTPMLIYSNRNTGTNSMSIRCRVLVIANEPLASLEILVNNSISGNQVFTYTDRITVGEYFTLTQDVQEGQHLVTLLNLNTGIVKILPKVTEGALVDTGYAISCGSRPTDFNYKVYGEIGYINDGVEEYWLNNQQGLKTYSESGLEASFSRTTANLWSIKTEFINPFVLTKNTKLWTNDGGLTVLVTPNSVNTVAGYVEIGSFDNQGILKGLTNTYNGILYTPLIGEKSFTEISDEAETDTFEKPGETENTIPQVIVKA